MATGIKLASSMTRLSTPLFPLILAVVLFCPPATRAEVQTPGDGLQSGSATPVKPSAPAAPAAAAKPAGAASAKAKSPGAAPKQAAVPTPAKPAAVLPAVASPAAAPTSAGLGLGTGSGPVDVTSDESLEMQQSNKVYIARGNAVAKRGDRTLYADTLMAYYRDVPNTSQTEIWRVVADGHVKITTPTQTVVGDHADYDMDQGIGIVRGKALKMTTATDVVTARDSLDTKTDVITGKDLKLTTPVDVVTARDSLEYYEDKSLAVARGDALAIRHTPKGDRRIRGDVLVAVVVQPPGEPQRISRVDGTGHVVVSSQDQIGTGDQGVYNAETGIATLTHHVTLARGENTLTGEYGVVDTDKGVSRLLPRPPTEQDQTRGRVNGYIVPRQKSAGDASGKPAVAAPQKAQPDPTKMP